MKIMQAEQLYVKIFETAEASGYAAARDIGETVRRLLQEKEELHIVFAAAPSQNYVLKGLLKEKIAWERIRAYHMDEYIGLPAGAPQRFGFYLQEHIFRHIPLKSVEYICASAADAEKEAARYEKLLQENPPDIFVMGIGENGHIAFNDPPADFQDTKWVKTVRLAETCRWQQVHDGCFATIATVPTHAITLTVPVFLRAPYVFCIVPYASKAEAVYKTVYGAVSETCPASVLKRHPHAVLYLDQESSGRL